jgi:hypothetical protein
MDETGSKPREKIEDQISKMAQPILNIIAEDMEEPHIPKDVKESPVKKHGS